MTDRTTKELLKAADRAINNIRRDAKDGISLCHEERLTSLIAELSAKLREALAGRGEHQIIYKHYKGGLYEWLEIVSRESDGKTLVLYRSCEDGLSYVRPDEEFYAKFTEVLRTPPKKDKI